jgi:hypothetical protein
VDVRPVNVAVEAHDLGHDAASERLLLGVKQMHVAR